MVVEPKTVPHPGSVMDPPVVDPKMAIDPDAARSPSGEPGERDREPSQQEGTPR
ncbi:MAG TPA: hypothetical protein VFS39_06080 [Nitrospira sp.]|nr:hypothetical protein [Nitrospira sp.]